MVSTTFSKALSEITVKQVPGKQQNSWAWFLENARNLREQAAATRVNPAEAVTDPSIPKLSGELPNAISGASSIIGKMILFEYDPKTKATLPYWDQFPVIFPINIYGDGYLGLNLHYLPVPYRAKLMDGLYGLVVNKEKMNETTMLKISYNLLENYSRLRYFKPCVKRYLYSHVRSEWSVIPVKDWDTVMMLPLQRFHKASDSTVWAQSIRGI